jgi:hypothetical protein
VFKSIVKVVRPSTSAGVSPASSSASSTASAPPTATRCDRSSSRSRWHRCRRWQLYRRASVTDHCKRKAPGRAIPELGLRRIEDGNRRMDVDDLMALAEALKFGRSRC